MLSSKLKAKKLNSITENSITYIVVPDKVAQEPILEPVKAIAKPRTTVATVLALYQRENQQLKDKILQLENKIDKLIDDKEQMLRDEMQKIEKVYSSKDAQLKTILELVNTKLMMDHTPEVHEVETIEGSSNAQIEQEDPPSKIIELKSYIRTLELKSYQRKIIKKRFLAVYDSDIRILQQNGKLYLDFSKYDYSDLLEY